MHDVADIVVASRGRFREIQAIETVNRHGASGVAVRAGDHFRVVAAEAIVHALRRDQNSRLSGVDFETLPSRELEFRGNDVTRVYIPASVASRSLQGRHSLVAVHPGRMPKS